MTRYAYNWYANKRTFLVDVSGGDPSDAGTSVGDLRALPLTGFPPFPSNAGYGPVDDGHD